MAAPAQPTCAIAANGLSAVFTFAEAVHGTLGLILTRYGVDLTVDSKVNDAAGVITYTLNAASKILKNQTITMAYDDAPGDILDATETDELVEFTAQAVTNNSTVRLAKPAVPEVLSTHDTATALKCFVPVIAGEVLPRCIGNNVMAEPYCGQGYGQTGPIPDLDADGLDIDGLSESAFRIMTGDAAFLFVGCGWTNTATPRTIAFLVKLRHNADIANGGAHIVMLGGSDSTYYIHGPAISIATNGTMTLGFLRSQGFFSSGITLVADRWYAVAVTIAAASGLGSRLFFVYDYTTHTATTTGSALTDSTAYAAGTSGDAVFNSGAGTSMWTGAPSMNPLVGDLAAFGLYAETWNPAVGPNTKWEQFYTDPWAVARGAYTPAGALTAGSVSVVSREAGVQLAASRPTGGTAPYTIQWYRATTSNFTPGSGNLLTGATTYQFLDTTAVKGTTYFYKAIWTDSAGSPASVTSAQVYGNRIFLERHVGLIGDSLLMANHLGRYFVRALRARNCHVGLSNRAQTGSYSYNATAASSWQPSAYQVGATMFDNALAEFVVGGVQDVVIALGTNDCSVDMTANNYGTYVGNMVASLVAAGLHVFLPAPPIAWKDTRTPARVDLLRQYQAKLAAMANGTTIFYLGDGLWHFTSSAKRETHPDGLHYYADDSADAVAADVIANAMVDTVYDPLPTPAAVGASAWSDTDSPVRTLTA